MSIIRVVGAGLMWNTSAVVLGKVLMFANVFLVLTGLTVYEYGFSELVLSIIAMAGVVFLPGLTAAITADMAVARGRSDFGEMSRVFHQHFLFNLILGVSAWAVLFFAALPVAQFAGTPYAAQFLQIVSFTFLLSPLRAAQQMLASVMLRFLDQSFYSIVEESFKLAFVVLFIVMWRWGIHGLMYAIFLSQLAVLLVYVPRSLSAYREFSRATVVGKYRFWDVLQAHRKWSVGASYVGTIAQNARLWIIKFFLGTEAVGLFSFAMGMFSHISSLLPLATVLAPVMPRYVDQRDQLARILRASVKFQAALGLFALVMAFGLTVPFVSILFPKYVDSIPLIFVFLLSIVPNSIGALFIPVFAAYKQQQSLLFANTFKAFLMAIFLPPSILLFGLPGIGVEVFFTTVGNGIERYRRLRRLLPEFSLLLSELFRADEREKEAMRIVYAAASKRLSGLLFWRR